MAEPKRKEGEGQESRASRRGVLRRARRGDDGDAAKRGAGGAAKEGGKGGRDGGKRTSPLLETTTQAGEEVRQLLEAAGDASKSIRELADAPSRRESGGEADETAELISKINKEAQQVLESADEAAEKIRAEARAEAHRVVEETRRRAESVTADHIERVTQLGEQVLGELSAVQGQLESLRRAFDQSISAMSADLGTEASDVWATQQNGAEEEEAEELRRRLGRRTSRRTVQEPEGISEGARLLALQQLMAGADAEVIEKRLRQEFGIEDPKPILDWMGVHLPRSEKPKKR